MVAISWFARLREASVQRIASTVREQGLAGVDVNLSSLGASSQMRREAVRSLADSGLRLILRMDTAAHIKSDSPADHINAASSMLEEARGFDSALTHLVLVNSRSEVWSRDESLDFFHGALALGASFLEDAPWVGASSRETDAFGGRPTHLRPTSLLR